jgi:hypothetical protein
MDVSLAVIALHQVRNWFENGLAYLPFRRFEEKQDDTSRKAANWKIDVEAFKVKPILYKSRGERSTHTIAKILWP